MTESGGTKKETSTYTRDGNSNLDVKDSKLDSEHKCFDNKARKQARTKTTTRSIVCSAKADAISKGDFGCPVLRHGSFNHLF